LQEFAARASHEVLVEVNENITLIVANLKGILYAGKGLPNTHTLLLSLN
jgi:hypothetical protein